MRSIIAFYGFFAFVASLDSKSVRSDEESAAIFDSASEDARLNFVELSRKYGYPAETHFVATADGYILKLHRIPFGRKCGPGNGTKIPVLLQHGLLSQSIDWNIMGPDNGLGYILADECFDVWFGNSRGNRQSRGHATLSERDAKFWEFSWHELGVGDLPAVIDYVLETTSRPDLHYVGHSQGTTQFFVYASTHPERAERKVRSMYSLAPIAFMKNLKSPLVRSAMLFLKPLQVLAGLIGLNELLPTCDLLRYIGSEICTDKYPDLQGVCTNMLFLLCGYDVDYTNMTMLPVIMGHTPAGASVRQLVHYAQCIDSGEFRQFDRGLLGNLFAYRSLFPPRYPLEKIRVPVALFYSGNDWLADVGDVRRLADSLPNLIGSFRIRRKEFNHLGFIWATDVRPLLYDRLVSLMKRY